ncbi:MAG: apolipoprotein N-acyltransferase [Paracoccaceae bacterium]
MSRTKGMGSAVVAGAVAALGHAPFGIWPIALLGFVYLIYAVAYAARPALIGWAGALGYFAVALHWIVEPFLVDAARHGWMAPFALVLMAGGLALFWGLAGWLANKITNNNSARALAFAVCVAGAEMLRGHILTGFPWALPAYIWADTPLRVATAWTGSYGLSLITLLAAALPTFLSRKVGLVAAVCVLGCLAILGHVRADYQASDQTDLGRVRLVQPNVPQNEKWDPLKVPSHIERMLALTRGSAGQGLSDIDLVVWPEAAVAYRLDQAGLVLQAAAQAATTGAGTEAKVILGINRTDGENWFNALAVVGPDGNVEETYDKVHLVPFGEYIPFRLKIIQAMAATSGFGFSSGERVRLIDTPLGRALPLICYEGIFPGHVFRADERPDYLLQITNDAWFGEFSGPYQHLDQARFRSAEQGLPMVRVANTGISTVIDPFGGLQSAAEIRLGEQGYRDVAVWSIGKITFYARFGEFPTIIGILLMLSVLMWGSKRNTIAKPSTTS